MYTYIYIYIFGNIQISGKTIANDRDKTIGMLVITIVNTIG